MLLPINILSLKNLSYAPAKYGALSPFFINKPEKISNLNLFSNPHLLHLNILIIIYHYF